MSDKDKIKLICLFVTLIFILVIGYYLSPDVRKTFNNMGTEVQMADDVSRYETIRQVEDTCRAMIAQYESDKLTYEQYISSDSKQMKEWAEQARMRANRTASTYNNYILKNKFVWRDNIPSDIVKELPFF